MNGSPVRGPMNRAEGKTFFKMRDADGTTLATKTKLVFAPAFFAFATPNFVVGMEHSIFGHAPARGTTANLTAELPASINSIG
jgi:hypothetical protein